MQLLSDTAQGFEPNFKPWAISTPPSNISTIPSHPCLSIAIPIYAASLVFSSIFFVGICLGSSRRLNCLMEGTLFLPFLCSPDNHYCRREAQSLRTLHDLLKVTSNQH